jgi:hypothetical protein
MSIPEVLRQALATIDVRNPRDAATIAVSLIEYADEIEGAIGALNEVGGPADCAAPVMREAAAILAALAQPEGQPVAPKADMAYYNEGCYVMVWSGENARQKALSHPPSAPQRVEAWISVEEQTPPESTLVLVYTPSSEWEMCALDTWNEQHEAPLSFSSATIPVGFGWDNHEWEEVTHWMPLPPAPGAASQQAEPASLDAVIDLYTSETGGPDKFDAEVLQRFIDKFPRYRDALNRYASVQLTSRPAIRDEMEAEPASSAPASDDVSAEAERLASEAKRRANMLMGYEHGTNKRSSVVLCELIDALARMAGTAGGQKL